MLTAFEANTECFEEQVRNTFGREIHARIPTTVEGSFTFTVGGLKSRLQQLARWAGDLQANSNEFEIVATLLTRKHEDVLIAYFQDVRIIDETRIQSLHQELMDLVTNTGNEKIVLNFQNVSFMSSAMLGKLIQFAKHCKSTDVSLRLCNINENVGEVFRLMKLDKVFAIEADEEKALESFTKKGWFG